MNVTKSVHNTSESLKILTSRLDKSDRVFFTRFGDVELKMINGENIVGGNKNICTQGLREELKKSFSIKHEDYLIAASGKWENEEGMTKGCLQSIDMGLDGMYLNPVLFHYLVVFNNSVFEEFMNRYIRPFKKLYIGCIPPDSLTKILGKVDYWTETPPLGAHATIDKWFKKIPDVKIVIPSCGESSKVINYRMWERGLRVWSLDMGSMFSALVFMDNRGWLRKHGQKIREQYLC